MWWLCFRDNTAVVIGASSLSHARMLAATKQLGRVSQFVDGYFLDPGLAAKIPPDAVERLLSRGEADQLCDRLEREWNSRAKAVTA